MNNKSILITFLVLSFTEGLAQKIKWGSPTAEEIALKECSYDQEANAAVTWAKGNIFLRMGADVVIEKHIRVKVLKQEGKEEANITIPFYSKNNFNYITSVNAQTINFDENGKKSITKVSNSDIKRIETDNNFSEIRFTFPNVGEGSILEYKYKTISKNYAFLEAWTFQNNIPTLRSEFKITIDNRLVYMYHLQGQKIYSKYANMPSDNHWILENLPAIVYEPYASNRIDYIDKARFQLIEFYNYSTKDYEKIRSDWNLVAKDYFSYPKVASYLVYKNKPKSVDEFIEQNGLINLEGTDEEKAKKIYYSITSNFKHESEFYDESTPSKTIVDFVKTKRGNQADFNLFFVYVCELNQIKAYPVSISPRGTGKLLTKYPLISQLLKTFSYVELSESKSVFVDPSASDLPFGMLESDYMVENAVIFSEKEKAYLAPTKYDLRNGEEFTSIINIKDLKKPSVQLLYKASGYQALHIKRNPNTIKAWFEGDTKFVIDSITMLDESLDAKPLAASIDLEFADELQNDNIIYLEPFISKNLTVNPFKSDQRIFPIDYIYTRNYSFRSTIIIPDGYQIDEIPKSISIKTLNGEVDFNYQAQSSGNTISLLAKMNINRTIVFPASYESLRSLYHEALNKLIEPVVLKKVN